MNTSADIQKPITDELIRAVADEAEVRERSVLRRLLNLKVRGSAGRRTDKALAARGFVAVAK